MIVVLPAILIFGLALLIGRPWVLVVPLIVWPAYVLGRKAGWWGFGVGDAWEYGLVVGTLAGLVLASAGMALHVAVARFHGHRATRPH